jgi:hypothetical protein
MATRQIADQSPSDNRTKMSVAAGIGKRAALRADRFRYLQLRPLIDIGVLRSGWTWLAAI